MNRSKAVVIFNLGVITIIMAVLFCQWTLLDKTPETLVHEETPEPPVPEETLNPFDYVVKVTAHNPRAAHVGVGTLVEYNGYTFVLTSKMIFTPTDTSYDVLFNGITYSAGVILNDETRGLVALDIPVDFDGIKVDEAPNLPPGAEAYVCGLESVLAITVDHWLTNPDWMIVKGNIPGTCTGAPIISGDYLAGVIIGINTENAEEAFAVGNHAIREFAKMTVEGEEPTNTNWEPLLFERY